MLLPEPRRAPRVLIPEGLMQVDASEHEDVRPAVSVEVMDVGEHAIGWTRGQGKLFGRIEFMLRLEVRPLIPKRPGDDIHFAVTVDIARRDSVAKIFVGQNLFLEGRQGWCRCGAGRDQGQQSKRKELHS